jgi:hypothetical protein
MDESGAPANRYLRMQYRKERRKKLTRYSLSGAYVLILSLELFFIAYLRERAKSETKEIVASPIVATPMQSGFGGCGPFRIESLTISPP